MRVKPLPPVKLLHKLLRYEPETGLLYWRPRTPNMFSCGKQSKEISCNQWNAKNSGKIASWPHGCGYSSITIFGKKYLSHRIIWSIYYGENLNCEIQIDHINGSRIDNKIINLRQATVTQQRMNAGTNKNNTSGCKGVFFEKRRRKWVACIGNNKKQIYLGQFDNFEDAVKARKNAEKLHFGRFAREN